MLNFKIGDRVYDGYCIGKITAITDDSVTVEGRYYYPSGGEIEGGPLDFEDWTNEYYLCEFKQLSRDKYGRIDATNLKVINE